MPASRWPTPASPVSSWDASAADPMTSCRSRKSSRTTRISSFPGSWTTSRPCIRPTRPWLACSSTWTLGQSAARSSAVGWAGARSSCVDFSTGCSASIAARRECGGPATWRSRTPPSSSRPPRTIRARSSRSNSSAWTAATWTSPWRLPRPCRSATPSSTSSCSGQRTAAAPCLTGRARSVRRCACSSRAGCSSQRKHSSLTRQRGGVSGPAPRTGPGGGREGHDPGAPGPPETWAARGNGAVCTRARGAPPRGSDPLCPGRRGRRLDRDSALVRGSPPTPGRAVAEWPPHLPPRRPRPRPAPPPGRSGGGVGHPRVRRQRRHAGGDTTPLPSPVRSPEGHAGRQRGLPARRRARSLGLFECRVRIRLVPRLGRARAPARGGTLHAGRTCRHTDGPRPGAARRQPAGRGGRRRRSCRHARHPLIRREVSR